MNYGKVVLNNSHPFNALLSFFLSGRLQNTERDIARCKQRSQSFFEIHVSSVPSVDYYTSRYYLCVFCNSSCFFAFSFWWIMDTLWFCFWSFSWIFELDKSKSFPRTKDEKQKPPFLCFRVFCSSLGLCVSSNS